MSSAMLRACDRLGMLVVDEAFDVWTAGKSPFDTHDERQVSDRRYAFAGSMALLNPQAKKVNTPPALLSA